MPCYDFRFYELSWSGSAVSRNGHFFLFPIIIIIMSNVGGTYMRTMNFQDGSEIH